MSMSYPDSSNFKMETTSKGKRNNKICKYIIWACITIYQKAHTPGEDTR